MTPAFRTAVSRCYGAKIILWTDIGANHVMKDRKMLQVRRATGRAYRLVRFNLHLVASPAQS